MRTPPVRCGGERGMDTRFTPPAMKGHTQSTFHDDEFPRDPLPADSFGPPLARIRGLPYLCSIHTYKSTGCQQPSGSPSLPNSLAPSSSSFSVVRRGLACIMASSSRS